MARGLPGARTLQPRAKDTLPVTPLLLAVLLLLPCSRLQVERAVDPGTDEVALWRAHYERVERELRTHVPAGLDGPALAARARLIEALADYRERGDFTRQIQVPGALLPQFVDAEGRRCAVAELLHASGQEALIERVRAANNSAWIADLAHDPGFRAWLRTHGLDLEEVARIQTPAFEGPADRVPPGGGAPSAGPGDAPERPGPPSGAPPAGAAGPVAVSVSSSARAGERPLDAWWVWWEFNKLVYLGVQGMEGRLVSEASRTSADAALMTEPLRTVRSPILLAALRDPDALVRASAALALGRVARERAVAPLVQMLGDPSQRVREHALFGLGASGTSTGARVLLALLEHGGSVSAEGELVSPRAMPFAILALAIGRREGMEPALARSVALFAPRAPDSMRDGALWAACLFHRLAPSPSTEALALEVVQDARAARFVRAAAIEALGPSADPKTLARLQDLLVGRNLELRRSAALALGRSPQALALPALMTAYELEGEPLARGFLLLSIGMHGGPAARDLLLEALAQGPIAVEPWAALALGIQARTSGDTAIRKGLRAALPQARNEDSRPALLLALGLARDPAVEPVARATLEGSPSPRDRGYAATALALLGGSGNRDHLRARLPAERSNFVRATIAQALSTLGNADDAPGIFEALTGLSDPGLKAVTAASLGLLGAPAALPELDELAREATVSALVRATALDGLGLLLERGEPLVLPEASQGANYAVYEDWAFDLFQLAL